MGFCSINFFVLSSKLIVSFFYVTFIRGKKLPWKGIFAGILLFVGLHSFHLIPSVLSLFDPGSNTNTRVFSREDIVHQLDYFFGVLPFAKVSLNILSLPPVNMLGFTSVMVPLVVILGFLLNRGRNKTMLLTGIFLLIILFLLSAKITDLGVEIYKRLFTSPDFRCFAILSANGFLYFLFLRYFIWTGALFGVF